MEEKNLMYHIWSSAMDKIYEEFSKINNKKINKIRKGLENTLEKYLGK